MEKGDLYDLTAFSMCAHNGTHIDAPRHFIQNGQTVEQIPIEKLVGRAYVAFYKGDVDAEAAHRILDDAKGAERILLKGDLTVTEAAARVFAEKGIYLLGNESQTVGPEQAPMAVHLVLLGAGVVLLEGIRLQDVPQGHYLLCAAPLLLGGAEGAPCRAILMGD